MKELIKRLAIGCSDRIAAHVTIGRYNAACAYAARQLPGYLPRVFEFLNRRVAQGSQRHDYAEWKLLELAFELERSQPDVVVEFGSGTTTALLAEYAHRRPQATVISVDENAEYHQTTRQTIDPAIRESVHYSTCRRMIETIDGVEVCFYSDEYRKLIPQKMIDMTYVDGPYNMSPTRPGKDMPCVDHVQLLQAGYCLQRVLFDYRLSSVSYLLDSRFGPLYDADLVFLLHKERTGYWSGATDRHHSVLERRAASFALGQT